MLMSALLKPVSLVLEEILDRLSEKDKEKVFAAPVTLDGYKDYIKHPMDLSTMRKKVEKGKYDPFTDSIAALRTDVLLMTDNCEKFNVENSYFLQYGRKFRKIALQLLDKEEDRERTLEKLLSCEPEESILAEVSRVGLYDVLEADISKEESEQESDLDKKKRTHRPREAKDSGVSSTAESKQVGGLGLGSFLAPNVLSGGLFTINGSTSKTKRRTSPVDKTPSHKRRKKETLSCTSLRQSPITSFLSPSPLTGRRSIVRQNGTAPLMAFRNNSVKRGWYSSRDVRYLNTSGDNMSSLSSFKLAMKWQVFFIIVVVQSETGCTFCGVANLCG
ncbi:Bromodomain protein [Ancylostoma duodenale]|uniref:Bromodomain protein n=1 Tax=Ancylostoma duodenale TaxID=51022 RepID=A0A0C2GYG5_9BILA|nr:Bromodomain protein [Ancylostoma duodenale]